MFGIIKLYQSGINVKCMHANQLFELLTTTKGSVDDRRQRLEDFQHRIQWLGKGGGQET